MKKSFLPAILLIFTVNAVNAGADVTNIPAEQVKKMQDDQANFKLIDARDEKRFAAEHIVGAINIPADKVDSKSLADIAPDVKTKLVFYCQDPPCNASHIASQKALGAGYQYVYRYSDGIVGWKQRGYATEVSK